MNTREKGSAKAVVMGVAALAILVFAGIGYHAYNNPLVSRVDYDNDNDGLMGAYATSTIGTVATTTSAANEGDYVAPKPRTASRQSSNVASAYTGAAYRNPTFGLTVPGNYQTSVTQRVYAGVPTTASIDFFSNGAYAYTINVFSKEQWNDIRIQETRNIKEGTGPDYLGEGRYIGENKTWIYSQVSGQFGGASPIYGYSGSSYMAPTPTYFAPTPTYSYPGVYGY